MLQITHSHTPPASWDDRLHALGPEAGLLQSSFWGELMRALGRGQPHYLEVNDSEGRLAASLMFIHTNLATKAPPALAASLGKLSWLWPGMIDFADGPVIHAADREAEAWKALLAWLDSYRKKQRILQVRCQGLSCASRQIDNLNIPPLFLEHGYRLSPWATYLVDLTPPEDAIWMTLDHAARKGVKKASREGLRIRQIEAWDDYVGAFLQPYSAWNGKEEGADAATAHTVWLQPAHHGYYRYYVAEFPDGSTAGVLGMTLFGGVATEITSGMSPQAMQMKLPVQDLLHWEMMRAAKLAGCHTFNLAGVSPCPTTIKEHNIRRFKKKWGGEYLEYARFVWTSPLLTWANALKARVAGQRRGPGGETSTS